MEMEKFEALVGEAVLGLPEELRDRLENVDIVVAAAPTTAQRRRAGLPRSMTLLGLYEGVPLTRRGAHYGMVPPDVITIFQKPIEEKCRSDAEIVREVRTVVRHEIAHHFGISDTRLKELGHG
jgi:predicted Zn-dependent protease with MMP-like domain